MSTLMHDIRYAGRTLVKEPGFSLVAVLILAVGIGANVAMFSVTDAVLLRALPFPDAERLVLARTSYGEGLGWNVSSPDYYDYRDQNQGLESLAAVRSGGLLPGTRSGGLVWCLQEDEAGRFGPNYFLGRLAEVVQPGRIEILLFPNAWSSAGQPGWLDEIGSTASLRYDSENLAVIAELAKKSCDGIPVGIHQVAGPDNLAANFSRAGESGSLWRRVAVTMIADQTGC